MRKSRRMRQKVHIARMRGKRITYKILITKSEGRKLVGKSRRRCGNDIKMDLKVIECEGVDWIHLGHVRNHWPDVVNTIMIIRVL
jgi:hypothetical protein